MTVDAPGLREFLKPVTDVSAPATCERFLFGVGREFLHASDYSRNIPTVKGKFPKVSA